jgi:hemolysin activation/secretion protein
VYQTFANNLSLGLNFTLRESQTLSFGSCEAGSLFAGVSGLAGCKTQVTVLRASQHATHRGETNTAVFYSTFNVGLDLLGATTTQTGGQSGQFFSWLGQSMFTQRLWENGVLLVMKANMQLADRPILPLERFSVGGVYTVRGYRENTYIRDNGFNTNLELKYPLYGGNSNEKNNLYLTPFMDYGGGWNNQSGTGINQPANYLFSSGIGLNWQYKQVTADFYWAHAFIAAVPKPTGNTIQDDGIHFRVNFTAF